MNKVLVLTSVASMIDQFNIPNIKLLQSLGFSVDVACNFNVGNTCSEERINKLKKNLKVLNVHYYQIDFSRNVLNITKNLKAFWQVKCLMEKKDYSFVHCHSPIGGVVGRICGKLKRTKVIYTAHGFHFYKGAPYKNWLIYYPIEKIFSYFTDTLITINKEDYALAQKKMKAKEIVYIPGIGIDLKKYRRTQQARVEKRKQLEIDDQTLILFSVGELNKNKNHQIIIKSLANLSKTINYIYIIAGKGELENSLKKLIAEVGLNKKVKLLGFRDDIPELFAAADLFIFPSFREGLSVSLMEAMASGLPVICSRIRGNLDLIDSKGGLLFDPHNEAECLQTINEILNNDLSQFGCYNLKKIEFFGLDNVLAKYKTIYTRFLQ